MMDVSDIVTGNNDSLQGHGSESDTKLSDLIDDCLIHIFLLLDNKDLLSVAAVNSKFRDISRIVFPKNNKWMDVLESFEECSDAAAALQETKDILKQFGDLIVSTGFDYSAVKKKIMRKQVHDLIMEHCSNTLEEINFLGLNDSLKFTKPFPKVKKLYFHDGSYHHSMSEIGKFFPNVETIGVDNIQEFSWNWGLQLIHIPSLQNFENGYDCSHYAPKPNMGWNLELIQLNLFIAANPQLRKLSASLNGHYCSHLINALQPFPVMLAHEQNVNDHPMSFKITAKSCAADCDVVNRLIVPYERVESLELCLKGLAGSEFVTKCRNIKKLKLYLRFDSKLFNASYFNEIASALPQLEELLLSLDVKEKFDFYSEIFGNHTGNQTNYEKGSIRAIHPFLRQCTQLRNVHFRYSFDHIKMDGPKKTELTRKYNDDILDFDKIIRDERLCWASSHNHRETFGSIGYTYELTKKVDF